MEFKEEASEEATVELEEHFILRLPLLQAEIVRKALKKRKSKKLKKMLCISLNNDNKEIRTGTVRVKKQVLQAKLVDLPCIIDSNKTTDKIYIFKTANISQMLLCQETPFDTNDTPEGVNVKKPFSYPHGITPPLKNVKKQRFRKVLKNKDNVEKVIEIEKELLLLLRTDNEACSTRFEIIYEEVRPSVVNECVLFGELITDSDSDQESCDSVKSSACELNGNYDYT